MCMMFRVLTFWPLTLTVDILCAAESAKGQLVSIKNVVIIGHFCRALRGMNTPAAGVLYQLNGTGSFFVSIF
jgi:hypothetical protein